MERENLASNTQKRVNRSTTHIRIKKQVKFDLERWMQKHRVKTYSQAIRRLLEATDSAA
ncbi:MAG: hypothetical protein QXI12_00615 [Candidatus Methanomethyliaceae archaeon]